MSVVMQNMLFAHLQGGGGANIPLPYNNYNYALLFIINFKLKLFINLEFYMIVYSLYQPATPSLFFGHLHAIYGYTKVMCNSYKSIRIVKYINKEIKL